MGEEVSVPMQFGLFGEVNWSLRSRHAYLLFPGLCGLLMLKGFSDFSAFCGFSAVSNGLSALARALPKKPPVPPPSWVRDEEAFRRAMDLNQEALCLVFSPFFFVLVEQVPAIARGEQKTL